MVVHSQGSSSKHGWVASLKMLCMYILEECFCLLLLQVLPCYVIVVREGGKNSKESHPPPLSSLLDSSTHSTIQRSEETVEQKRARLAARVSQVDRYMINGLTVLVFVTLIIG